MLVPTCLKKLFALGPRKKYVDIVTDTLRASSSDLLTWNTLVMMKLGWINYIPREWIEITTKSLDEWKERDEKPPFLSDNQRGYARVTPVALSITRWINILEMVLGPTKILRRVINTQDMRGLIGLRRLLIQAMIDQPARNSAGTAVPSSHSHAQSVPSAVVVDKGSNMSSSFSAPHPPEASEDVSMETSADKRSRESPDTTNKPDGKPLKTSESASPSPARHDLQVHALLILPCMM